MLGPDHPRTFEAVIDELLKHGQHAAAEPLLRECVAIRVKSQPDAWFTFVAKAMLGSCLLGQKKYSDAEPLLKEGHEGLKQREKMMPPAAKPWLTVTLEWLVQLYDAQGKTAEADRWHKELAARRASEAAKK